MKRSAAAFIFLLGMVAGAGVPPLVLTFHRPQPPRVAEMVERVSRDLSLDKDQKTKLQGFFGVFDEKMGAFQKETQERFDTLREENDARIAEILTPDQKVKFQAMRDKWRQRHGPTDAMRWPPPPPPDRN